MTDQSSTDWATLLATGSARRPAPIKAVTFKRKWASASQPVLVECEDGKSYVVKGKQAGRMIANDQILGTLGHAMGGPVPKPALVDVPQELIIAEPEMRHMSPGVAHGSAWLPDVAEREGIAHQDRPENRQRFAYLAALYGWAHANDSQFIYENAEPRRVHSVDHGHFFPGGPDWTIDTLQSGPPADVDAAVAASCVWAADQLAVVRTGLAGLTDEVVADAVARPPDEWNLSPQERLGAWVSNTPTRFLG